MWPETSSVKAVNLVKKSITVTEIIIFPKRLFFIGGPCRRIGRVGVVECGLQGGGVVIFRS